MATLGTKVISPSSVTSEPIASPPPQNRNETSTPGPVIPPPDIADADAPVSRLSPEKRAKINAKYEAKHNKNNEKHRRACERLAMESHKQESLVQKKQDKIDKKAKMRGDRINSKHSRKINKAERSAEWRAKLTAAGRTSRKASNAVIVTDQN